MDESKLLKLTEIEVTPSLSLSDIERDLQVLPYYIAKQGQKVEQLNRQIADAKLNVRKERAITYIQAKAKFSGGKYKAPATELTMHVDSSDKVLEAESILIELEGDLEHEMNVFTYYENRFVAIRKIASIREIELKRGA